MKKTIATGIVLFVFVMAVIIPTNFSFAEDIEIMQQTQEIVDSNDATVIEENNSIKESDSYQESQESNLSESEKAATETDASMQNTLDSSKIVTEEMEFLYIESKELQAPAEQNIVVSWQEQLESVSDIQLIVKSESGVEYAIKETKRTDQSVLFTKNYTVSETGNYIIKGIRYFIEDKENYFAFNDVEIIATFTVVQNQIENSNIESVAEINVDANGIVDKSAAKQEIKSAVKSTDLEATTSLNSEKDGLVVVLDPGHGGSDPGATRGSIYEKNLNLKVAQYCKAELEQYSGVTVYMTRTGDSDLSIEQITQIAANYGADILISIHQNAGSSTAQGAEVFYPNNNYKPEIGNTGKNVAISVQEELVKLGLKNRGIKIRNSENGSTYADGSASDYYGVIRKAKEKGIAAIIIEHAFLSNSSDYSAFLSDDGKLQKLGIADATGIAKAFGLSKGS